MKRITLVLLRADAACRRLRRGLERRIERIWTRAATRRSKPSPYAAECAGAAVPPAAIECTGLYSDLATKQIAPGVRSYAPGRSALGRQRGEGALDLVASRNADRRDRSERVGLSRRYQGLEAVQPRRQARRDAPLPEGPGRLLGPHDVRVDRRRERGDHLLGRRHPMGDGRRDLPHPDARRMRPVPSGSYRPPPGLRAGVARSRRGHGAHAPGARGGGAHLPRLRRARA